MKRRFGFIKSDWTKNVLALAEMYDSKGEYAKACRCLWDCAIRGNLDIRRFRKAAKHCGASRARAVHVDACLNNRG